MNEQKIDPAFIASHFLSGNFFVTLLEEKELWMFDKTEHIWKKNGESQLLSFISESYPETTKSDFTEIKFQVQKFTVLTDEQFKPNPHFLLFDDQVLNLKKLTVEDFVNPEYHLRQRLDTKLDLGAKPPMIFLKCLKNAVPYGPDFFSCLQAFSCILLIRTIRI